MQFHLLDILTDNLGINKALSLNWKYCIVKLKNKTKQTTKQSKH